MRRGSFLVLLAIVYSMLVTASVHVFMDKEASFEDYGVQAYAFERLLDRTAERPFVYRALMPLLVNRIDGWLPQSVQERYQGAAKALVGRYGRIVTPGFWTAELERKYLITFVLMIGFGLLALFALRDLTGAVFPQAPLLREAGPTWFGILLPLSFMNGGLMYDFSELFFLFLSATLTWRRRYLLLAPVLALAVFNKETNALLVVLLFVLVWHREERSRAIGIGIAMTAIAGAVLFGLRLYYAESPGSTMYNHIAENLEFWRQPSSWWAWMTVYTPLIPFPRGLNLLLIVPLAILILHGLRERPPEIRDFLLVSALVTLPLFFLFCWRDETRNLSLMYPAIYLNVCHALLVLYRRPHQEVSPGDR